MRHKVSGRKFNRTTSQRKAMFANLAKSLIQHEQIKTTLPKAKDLRPVIEKLLTKARRGGLHVRRQLISSLKCAKTAEHLMSKITPRFHERCGGYTRIIKSGFRYGDHAPMAIIEFVDFSRDSEEGKIMNSDNTSVDIEEEVKSK